MRRNGPKLFLYLFRHIESINESGYGSSGNVLIAAGKLLKSFVWIGIGLSTEDCLNGFRYYSPVRLKIRFECRTVEYELIYSL